MEALASGEPVSHRSELGEQPGGGVSQPVVALGVLFDVRVGCSAAGISARAISKPGRFGPAYRELSFDLFFSQHSFIRGRRCALLHRYVVPGVAAGRAMAGARMEGPARSRRSPGSKRWP